MGAINVNPTDSGVATSTAAAATINHTSGTITTEALTTAAGADYSFTLTGNTIGAASIIFISIANGTNTTLYPVAHSIQPAAGSATFKVRNAHASVALNGTLVVSFIVF
jgi:hypothetical protein